MKTNYHTHTTRCMHAVGDDEDYVRSAITGIKSASKSDWSMNTFPNTSTG